MLHQDLLRAVLEYLAWGGGAHVEGLPCVSREFRQACGALRRAYVDRGPPWRWWSEASRYAVILKRKRKVPEIEYRR